MSDNFQVRDANNLVLTVRSHDLGADTHVPLHGRFYRDIADTTLSMTTIGNSLVVDVRNITGLVLSFAANPTVAGATFVIEGSLNSTNGTDGLWLPMMGQRSDDPSQFLSTVTGIAGTLNYLVGVQVSGVSWFRVRCTAITSGALLVTASPCDDLVMPSRAPTTQAVSGTVTANVAGQAAHDAAVTGNPVRTATKAVNAMPLAVSATNDVADTLSTMQGVPLVTLDAVTAQRVRASVSLTATTDAQVLAAAAAGLNHHITDMQIINTGTATDLILRQGATEIWRLPLPQNVPVMINNLRSPLVIAGGSIFNAALSVAGTVRLNVQGYLAV